MLSAKTEEFWRVLRDAISSSANATVSCVRNPEESGGRLKGKYLALSKHLSNEEAIEAFRKVLFLVGYQTIASVLCVLDGSIASTDLHVVLRDQDTDEDLAPLDDDYLGAFISYLMDHEEEDDWPIRF